jgi:hypothetical protein
MIASIIGPQPEIVKPQSAAARLSPKERRELAVKVVARTEPVKALAEQNDVSRKFLYTQAKKAEEALEDAFDPTTKDPDSRVLFHIPVTKQWLLQVVLALVLICRSSIRGVCEFFAAVLDFPISVGSIHNILHQAAHSARQINEREDLSAIRVGAHDEIFQAGKPVLTGAHVASTYCYLMALAEHRDADTWGVHLLDLSEQGLNPDHTVADGGNGMRKAQADVWPGTPCRGDVFHPLLDMGRLSFFLKNRAKKAASYVEKLEEKIFRQMRRCKDPGGLYKSASLARAEAKKAADLAEAVETLSTWLREDILSLVGPDFETRQELFDFVVENLKSREHLSPRRIGLVRRALENQRDQFLAFAQVLDQELQEIARSFKVPTALVRGVYELQGLPDEDTSKWQHHARLRAHLGNAFYPIQEAVRDVLATTVRASSIIENLNSRLRTYFFLRRHLNQFYLDLLRFFLNHRRFLRSERPERTGKSPVEILTGRAYPHWLETLGFERFRRAA